MTTIIYKLGQNGLQVWKAELEHKDLYIKHGKLDGALQEEVFSYPTKEEAQTELERRRDKKLNREGYTYGIPDSVPDMPMLATEYKKQGDKLPDQVYIQPKLDGIRCIGSNRSLYTRRNEEIHSCPHIKSALAALPDGIKLDGELYCHGATFQEHLAFIKRDHPTQDSLDKVDYHVYDVLFDSPLRPLTFRERYQSLVPILEDLNSPHIRLLKTRLAQKSLIPAYLKQEILNGYEGIIIRDPDGLYEPNKRSPSLQKLKKFITEEYQILDIISAPTGREEGAALYVCEHTSDPSLPPKQFTVRPKISLAERCMIFQSKEGFIGQWTRITYAELSESGVPRMPIAEGLRHSPLDLN